MSAQATTVNRGDLSESLTLLLDKADRSTAGAVAATLRDILAAFPAGPHTADRATRQHIEWAATQLDRIAEGAPRP